MGCWSSCSSLSLLGVPITRHLCAVCHECDHQAQVTILELVHLRGAPWTEHQEREMGTVKLRIPCSNGTEFLT